MKQTYEQAIAQVFKDEGGYTDNPKDPGGPTNWGITLADAQHYWLPEATAADVKTMPKSVAETIYMDHYANPISYNNLPAGIDYSVLDYAINSGIHKSVETLQEIVGATVDGQLGEETLQATLAADAVKTINAIWDKRLAFDKSLPTWDVFGHGWTNRVNAGRSLALTLHNQYSTPTSASSPSWWSWLTNLLFKRT